MFGMGKKKDDEPKKDDGKSTSSEIDIPQLDKKKEDKKKPGGYWHAGTPQAAAWQGAKGAAGQAAGVAAKGAAGQAAGAAAGAASRSAIRNIITNLTSTLLGKAVLTAGIAAVVGGGAIAVMSLMAPPTSQPDPTLGGISSDIKVNRTAKNAALEFAAASNDNDAALRMDKTSVGGPAGESGETGETGDSEVAAADSLPEGGIEVGETGDTGRSNVPRLQGNNLSTSLGGSSFSGKVPKFGGNLGKAIKEFKKSSGKKVAGGNIRKMDLRSVSDRRGRVGRRGLGRGGNRALAQARLMSGYNTSINSGGSTISEAQADAASAQFEGQSETEGAETPSAPMDGTTPVTPTCSGCGGTGLICGDDEMLVQGVCEPLPSGGEGEDKRQEEITKLIDEARGYIKDYLNIILAALIILVAFFVAALAGWIATACSSGWLGWFYFGLFLVFSTITWYLLDGLADKVKAKAEAIKALTHPDKPMSETIVAKGFSDTADKMKEMAPWVYIPFIGSYLAYNAINDAQKDIGAFDAESEEKSSDDYLESDEDRDDI